MCSQLILSFSIRSHGEAVLGVKTDLRIRPALKTSTKGWPSPGRLRETVGAPKRGVPKPDEVGLGSPELRLGTPAVAPLLHACSQPEQPLVSFSLTLIFSRRSVWRPLPDGEERGRLESSLSPRPPAQAKHAPPGGRGSGQDPSVTFSTEHRGGREEFRGRLRSSGRPGSPSRRRWSPSTRARRSSSPRGGFR